MGWTWLAWNVRRTPSRVLVVHAVGLTFEKWCALSIQVQKMPAAFGRRVNHASSRRSGGPPDLGKEATWPT